MDMKSFCGFGGGSLAFWRLWSVVAAQTVVSISAIFSSIGAILRELWPFLCFWGLGDGETVVSISAIFSLI